MPGDAFFRRNPIDHHRLTYVLQAPLADLLIGCRDDAADLFEHGARYEDAAGFGDLFQPRRDIDRIAAGAALLDNHLTRIDADTVFNALLGRKTCVALPGISLHAQRALERFDGTREFSHQAVARMRHDSPMRSLDFAHKAIDCRVDAAMRLFFAGRHQYAVAADIRAQDRGQSSLDAPTTSAGAE